MNAEHLAALFHEGFVALRPVPGRDVLDRFLVYLRELRKWNEKINLTGYAHEREIIGKLFVDSLIWTRVSGRAASCRALDIGSGAGFPGLPIGIACPMHTLTLLEPNLKKAAFLHHVIGLLGVTNVRVESARAEAFSRQRDVHGTFDWVLMKALRLSAGLPYCAPLLSASGRCAVWRTDSAAADFAPRGFSVVREMPYELPFGFGARRLSILERRQCSPASRP